MTVKCDYCGEDAELVTGKEIYPHRPDLYSKPFWECKPCKAYVGCHEGTERKLGRLANAELRQAKSEAHKAFDPKWRRTTTSRKNAYRWLAEQLNIDFKKCHIGYFDVDMCNRVIEVCRD